MRDRHNPWLAIPLEEYERHMEDAGQLAALAQLFAEVLALCRPRSVAIAGIAGGNGLERVDRNLVKRIVGLDINRAYLDEAQRRYPWLETHCADLARDRLQLPQVELIHAGLIFEHAGLGLALENAVSLVAPGGHLSAVLQLPGESIDSAYASVRSLGEHFTLIDPEAFHRELKRRGLTLVHQSRRPLPHRKAFWLGVFSAPGSVCGPGSGQSL